MAFDKEKWNRWHPIARSIAQRLVAREDPDLTDDELAALQVELAALFDKTELRNAVRDILFLAAALEHEGATQVAKRLFALVENKSVIGALDRINHVRAVDRAEQVASRAKQFSAFSNRDRAGAQRTAPARESSSTARGQRLRDLVGFPILARV